MKKNKSNGLEKLYMTLIFLFLYAPIVVLIVFSFNDSRIFGAWTGFSFKWYDALFKNTVILNAVKTTLIVAGITTVVSTIIGTLAAVGIMEFRSKTRRVLLGLNDLPVLNPDIVIAISLMVLYGMLNLQKGMLTLILAHIAFTIPYVVLSVIPKIKMMDRNLVDAAMDLGATPLQAFFKVVIPEIKSGILAGAMMAFTLSLDDFVVSFFTTAPGINTISTTVFAMTKKGVDPSINALSAIMFIVVLTLLILANMPKKSKKIGE